MSKPDRGRYHAKPVPRPRRPDLFGYSKEESDFRRERAVIALEAERIARYKARVLVNPDEIL